MKKGLWFISILAAIALIIYATGLFTEEAELDDAAEDKGYSLESIETILEERESELPLRRDNEARILWHNNQIKKTEYCFLYLHGFAGSYRDGYPLNKIVAEKYGANLYMARMAGHGYTAEHAMEDFTAEEAYENATEDLALAQKLGEKVIILSTSTGGTLALTMAANFPEKIHALINISPNIKDEQWGASLLSTALGEEIANVVFLGDKRRIEYEEDSASLYWDTIYPVKALQELQILLDNTMKDETFSKVTCPVLTIYYYKNFVEKDWHVDVDEYEEVYEVIGTPKPKRRLVALEEPGTHFIGSSIKSKNYKVALEEIYSFCNEVLNMKPVK